MDLTWLITSSNVQVNKFEELIFNKDYNLYCNNKEGIYKSESEKLKYIIINGYVTPRYKYYNKFKNLNQYQLVEKNYLKYGDRFTNYIKGTFAIVLIGDTEFSIFNDQFGIYKIFYHQYGDKYFFSNSSKLISNNIVKKKLNQSSIAIKTLINREIPGKTIIKGLKYLTPGSQVSLNHEKIISSKYWEPSLLLKKSESGYDFNYFANFISESIHHFSKYHKPQNNIISLTGGKDCRTLLAGLLKNGIIPSGFTYGNPNSKDATFAKHIAEKLKLNHKIYYPILSSKWFEDYAQKIIHLDNPTINIHRSHRLYAFENIGSEIGKNTSYYAGYMGGEFLMGFYYDDLIFSKYLNDYWDTGLHGDITKSLSSHFIKDDIMDENDLIEKMSGLRSLDHSLSKELMEFYSFFEIGIPHHSQDIYLASTQFNYTIPFFIDIDFLEFLFASNYSFFNRNNKTKNLLDRYRLYEFNLNIQHILYSEMDELSFSKKGALVAYVTTL